MNKKLFLPSIGLMALLAACSNDELFENKPVSVDNNGRPQVNVILGVENPGLDMAETKMAGEANETGYKWLWRPNDVLGGALFSDVDNKIFNNQFLANYNFVRSDREESNENKGEASFKSYSSVTQGAYLFYHPYISDGKRNVIGHVLGDGKDPLRVTGMQVGDEGFDKLADVQGDGTTKNFFFSSLNEVSIPFDIEKGVAVAEELPLKFASAYSFFRIELGTNLVPTLTTNYYENFSISKIEVTSLNDETPFRTAFTIDPTVIADIQKDIFWSEEGAVEDNGALTMISDKTLLAEREETVRKALRQEKYKFDHISGYPDNEVDVMKYKDGVETNKLIYVLSTPYEMDSKDDKFVLWIPVPAGTYKPAEDTWEFNGVEKKATGALKIEVYTSEGKATFHLNSKQTTDGSITLARDNANKFNQTLVIDGDNTNIDLYSFNQGFEVATNEEYDFAIKYIKEHSKEFSNRTPLIKLSGDITIKEMFDQALQITTDNNSTITLKNEEGKEFTLDPEKTILGENGKDVPTLKVAEGNTLNFAKDIKFLQLINNGTVNANQNVTMQSMTSYEGAELNISEDKNVIVNANTTNASAYNVNLGAKATFIVNAKDAAVNGTMTVENGAAVTLKGTTANATNNVTLKPASTLTVNNGEYTTSGTLAIQAVEKNISIVNVTSDNTVNEGAITVGGKLTAKALTNAQNASLTVNAATCEGRDISGTVALKSLTNNGNVVTKKAETTKNYFGGTIDVETLNNNNVINTNGELVVTTGGINALDAEIVLLDDRYSLIQLPKNYTNNGVITISKPENYCMFTYYKQYNKLNGLKGTGTIEATIESQEQYQAVLAQQAEYWTISNDKYTAWDVINKFYVTSPNLELTNVSSKITKYKKDVVLENAKVTIVDDLVVDQLIANNTTELTANGNVEFTANNVVVNKDRELTIGEKVKLRVLYKKFSASSKNYMMDIAGKLTNNGWIDTEESNTDVANNLSVLVQGELLNNGKLSQKAIPGFSPSDSEYKFVLSIMNTFFDKNGNFLGDLGTNGKRIMKVAKSKKLTNWTDCGNGELFTKADLAGILKSASSVENIGAIFAGDNWAGMIIISGNNKYILHDGNHVGSSIFDKYTDTTAAKNALTKTDKGGIYLADVVFGIQKNAVYGPTWFYIYENTGIVDLLNKEWAYGEIVNGDNGTLKGQWSKSK